MTEPNATSRTMREPSIPPTLITNNSDGCGDISMDLQNLELGISQVKAETQNIRVQTDTLMVQTAELTKQTVGLTGQAAGLKTRVDNAAQETNDLSARINKLREQIDDLTRTREFTIHLDECFYQYPQFVNPNTGKIRKYHLPIRAYCPASYWGRITKTGKFLREIHIKISDDNLPEYATKYDFKTANDILRCVIQGYKNEKRIRIIAKDYNDGVEYWYFQLQVADNQECIDLTKQIVNKWLAIVFKQSIRDICPVNY